jgi:hypothetical protein
LVPCCQLLKGLNGASPSDVHKQQLEKKENPVHIMK